MRSQLGSTYETKKLLINLQQDNDYNSIDRNRDMIKMKILRNEYDMNTKFVNVSNKYGININWQKYI